MKTSYRVLFNITRGKELKIFKNLLNALVKQGTRSFPYSVIRETKKILKTKHKLTTVAADESFEEVLFSFDVDINYKKLV